MTATERSSDIEITTYTIYLTREGEQWGVYYENDEDNWLRLTAPHCSMNLWCETRF